LYRELTIVYFKAGTLQKHLHDAVLCSDKGTNMNLPRENKLWIEQNLHESLLMIGRCLFTERGPMLLT